MAVILNSWPSFDVMVNKDSSIDLKQSILMIIKKVLILDPKVSNVAELLHLTIIAR